MASTAREARFSAHIGFLFTEQPFLSRVAAAARYGFAGVEYPAPYTQASAPELAKALRAADVAYVQFATRPGDTARGEKGIAIFPERQRELRDSVHESLDYAEATGVRFLHVLAGVLPRPMRTAAHVACYQDALAFAADAAASRGMVVLVEAQSRAAVPDYFLETPAEAAAAIAAVGRPNIKLLFDVFHTVASGLDPCREIATYAPLIAHVHISDHPGRHEPGTGVIDFGAVRAALDQAGYDGLLGCEYTPVGETEAGLGWMATASTSGHRL